MNRDESVESMAVESNAPIMSSAVAQDDNRRDDKYTRSNLELLRGVELPVTLCFGRRRMLLRDVLELNPGSVVELDRQVEEPVELLLDGRVVARGEVVVVDQNYGLRICEVVGDTPA
jgi:flagellar motor switch protein FliN